MKIKPILYSTPMVQAIQQDRKTKTRRTKGLEKVNEKPNEWIQDGIQIMDSFIFHNIKTGDEFWVKSPYGIYGDILWVRESFFLSKFDEDDKCFIYKADLSDGAASMCKWKPSIHMPKVAARIFLQIKSISLEHLQDITEADAIAEGIKMTCIHDDVKQCMFKNYINNGKGSLYPIESFKSLWESINGKESIDLNPWVWVIEFEKAEKPENFL